MDPLEQVITAGEAASALGVSRRRALQLIDEAEIRHRVTKGGVLLLRADIERLAAQRQNQPVKRGPRPRNGTP